MFRLHSDYPYGVAMQLALPAAVSVVSCCHYVTVQSLCHVHRLYVRASMPATTISLCVAATQITLAKTIAVGDRVIANLHRKQGASIAHICVCRAQAEQRSKEKCLARTIWQRRTRWTECRERTLQAELQAICTPESW